MRNLTLIILLTCYLSIASSGREGMWMPQLLKALNETEMKSMGLKINAEDIYSINNSSLKDAIVHFGGGCTGEVVSSKGLLFTNHHCGYRQIQSLSSVEKNHLRDGYWAHDYASELPCQGLTVTFIREITDVSIQVLNGVSDTLNEVKRMEIVTSRIDSIEKTVTGKRKGVVRSFYQGNKYYLFNTEVFTDIRFVGAPPEAIGKFGGEEDNWMWPRHTGDFAMFRIYAGKDNLPAAFDTANVPYTPVKSLTINIGGVKANDFVFVFGFPGRTNEYLLSPGLEMIKEQTNPNRIQIRERKLEVLRQEMVKSDTVHLQYASKFSIIENSYKKWKGEMLSFARFDIVNKKMEWERIIYNTISDGSSNLTVQPFVSEYASVSYKLKPLSFVNDYYAEAFSGIELLSINSIFKRLISLSKVNNQQDDSVKAETLNLIKGLRGFYKNFNKTVDARLCLAQFELAVQKLDKKFLPMSLQGVAQDPEKLKSYINYLYKNSLVADSSVIIHLLTSYKAKNVVRLENDPAFKLYSELNVLQTRLNTEMSGSEREISRIQRRWLKSILSLENASAYYPDANGTLRVSYGKVEGMVPYDGVIYNYFTTAEGIYEKSMVDKKVYPIPSELELLIRNKDYGSYGKDGSLPVAFIASTHTTGGNSGSPCLNAKGELVGINFDRVWEGVASDYFYNESYSRNISVDIRYVLFIVEKLGKAERLIKEMNIVRE